MKNVDVAPGRLFDADDVSKKLPSRRHQDRTRTLLGKSVLATFDDEQITPELYGGAFPEHGSIIDGMAYTLERLDTIHQEMEDLGDNTETAHLVDLIGEASRLSQCPGNIYWTLLTAALPKEVNAILEGKLLPDYLEVTLDKQVQPQPDTYAFVARHPPEALHPEAHYAVAYGLGKAHEQAFDPKHISPSALLMAKACLTLSNSGGLGSKVTVDLLAHLEDKLGNGSELYHKVVSQQPYKFSLMRVALQEGASYDELRQLASDAVHEFMRQDDVADRSAAIAVNMQTLRFASNYEQTLRPVSVAYFSLLRAGYSSDEAIAGIYANGHRFVTLTRGVTDRDPTHAPLSPQEIRVTNDDKHMFDVLYRSLFDVKKVSDGLPELSVPMPPPYDIMAIPDHLPQHAHDRLKRVRCTMGRCPMRNDILLDQPAQTPDLPSDITLDPSIHTAAITQFQEAIRNRHGVDPHIIDHTRLRLTPLVVSLTVHAAEQYGLFEVLKYRYKTRGWL